MGKELTQNEPQNQQLIRPLQMRIDHPHTHQSHEEDPRPPPSKHQNESENIPIIGRVDVSREGNADWEIGVKILHLVDDIDSHGDGVRLSRMEEVLRYVFV